ncbi:TetR/AcrR family transcriptional regulator [Marinactinospora thermotolerans]|uniref:Transcriptional regulator, TetR family n=1 Tax=Marinactinospora thermotolerans DSM 45154 TaxID=1122192 RepID=A0A1T4SR71_9ACTN|nr:TetR/AcrR family transcriptional regulator [Marinactinospora thermotolerans]SKA30735.1 transcriptional regulator, TetR family [Marinactinospora thermotolerans DSM 45154]
MSDRNRTQATERPEPARRRRGKELIAAIHQAALEETAEQGLGRIGMEGIARRAGTAKTSLYRRWSSPEEIVLDALYHVLPVEEPSPMADDLRGDLIAALTLMRDKFMQPFYGAVVTAILAEAQRNPELRERLYGEVFEPRGGRFTRTVLYHYAERGKVDPARLTPVVLDIGEALMIKYGVDEAKLPDDAYIAAIVDQAILPALGHDAGCDTGGRGRPAG